MTERITNKDLRVIRCAAYHSGNHRLAVSGNRTEAECQGCGSWYTADEIRDAITGRTDRQLGQGGVTID
jgi:hypothetical protein